MSTPTTANAESPSPGLLKYTPVDDDESVDGPNLGADMAAIRARVLGLRGGANPADELTPDENREVYDELKSRHQVNLNLEVNAAALEDPTLIAHMEDARRRLAQHEKVLLRLPRREDLRTTYLHTMGKLSTLIRKLDDRHQAERENVEIGHRQTRVLGDLASGRKPHGFPAFGSASIADPGTKEAMNIASKKAAAIAETYEGLLALVDEAKQTLFVLRREIETFGDGFLELVTASEEDRRRLREFLQIASQSQAVKNAAAPSHSLGERLLTSAALPEHSGIEDTPLDE